MVMETEFITAVNHAAADDSVGCLVVTGAGRFCAGADINGWASRQLEARWSATAHPPWPPASPAKQARTCRSPWPTASR
jgi:enoyl-CoA hydratase/carnithine racemase